MLQKRVVLLGMDTGTELGLAPTLGTCFLALC